MKSGKGVFGIIIISLLLISSVGLVSAGIRDWLGFGDNKNLEGELPESAVARLSISETSPPVIPYVSVISAATLGASPDNVKLNIRVVNSGNTTINFTFVAQQGAGNDVGNLLDGTGTSATGYVFNGANKRFTTSCKVLGKVDWNSGTLNALNYSCGANMRYYDINGTWTVNISVTDTKSRIGYNMTKPFTVLQTYAVSTVGNYLNWTKNPLTTASTNVPSDNNITLTNDGNVAYNQNYLSTNATALNGTDPNPLLRIQQIPADKFRINGCFVGSNALSEGVYVNPVSFSLPAATNETLSTEDLPFCVSDLPAGLASQDYNSTRAWDLKFDSA